jgi:CubicO group peptidase (beta-lactamase class C family)
MIKFRLLLVFLAVAVSTAAQDVSRTLDELLLAYLRQGKFNGTALVAYKGKILLEKGYGWKSVADSSKNDDKTIYQIGSVTKQFTATLILQQQEAKKLSVEDKLSKYFPSYPKGDSITIHNLLTHTSGIYNYTNDGKFMTEGATKPQTRQYMMSLFENKPLGFKPGTKWSYCNSGYSLLGYILEDVTKKKWEQLMHERILGPLGMTNSGFDFVALKTPNKATGYFLLDAKANTPATVIDSTVAFAAGSLYSTVGDLYKWERAITAGKLLKPESWKAEFTPFKDKYAYGWFIDSLHGKKITRHGGGIYGFVSDLLRFPDDDLVIILLSNKPTGGLTAISNNLAAIVFKKTFDWPTDRKEISVPENILQQYVGEYQISPDFIITILLDAGKLKARATGQPEFQIFAEKENYFFLKAVDAQLEFVKDSSGKVEKMILYQGGGRTEGKKIK